jgi:hypothetical protein
MIDCENKNKFVYEFFTGSGYPQDPKRNQFAVSLLWFLDQLSPGNPAYNVCLKTQITGKLDTDALGRTSAKVHKSLWRRHEACQQP